MSKECGEGRCISLANRSFLPDELAGERYETTCHHSDCLLRNVGVLK